MSQNKENFDFKELLLVFGDLPKVDCFDESFDAIEIELHEKYLFTRECKLRTSRFWPFSSPGTDTLEASCIEAIETLIGERADLFLRELAETKSIKKTQPKSTFMARLVGPEHRAMEEQKEDILSRKEDFEQFSSPDDYGFDPDTTEEDILEYISEEMHTEDFDPLDYLDMSPSPDDDTWLPVDVSESDREEHYYFMDCYVALKGKKFRPQDKNYLAKAVKGFMTLDGTVYHDRYIGGATGETFVGRILIGDRILTESQLVQLAENYSKAEQSA